MPRAYCYACRRHVNATSERSGPAGGFIVHNPQTGVDSIASSGDSISYYCPQCGRRVLTDEEINAAAATAGSQLMVRLLMLAILVIVIIGLPVFLIVNSVLSRPSDKPGSTRFLDFKNGIGGMTFGTPVQQYKDLGFQFSFESSDDFTRYYTNNNLYRVTFGDYVLKDVLLEFVDSKLSSTEGVVAGPSTGRTNVVDYLTTLFGEPDEEPVYSLLQSETPKRVWRGHKVLMLLERDGDSYSLRLESLPLKKLSQKKIDEAEKVREKSEAELEKQRRAQLLKKNF